MTTTQLRVLFLGAGVQPWESLIPALHRVAATRRGIKLVGVYDIDLDRALSVARDRGLPRVFESYEETFEAEPNTEVVAVSHRHHASAGLRALRAGRHVFMEKPMATSAGEARRLVQEARSRDLVLMVDYQYPQQLRKVIAALEDGLVGDRSMVRGAFTFTNGMPDRPGFWDTPESGGVLLDYMGHLASVTVAVLGESRTPLTVTAQGWDYGGRQVVGQDFRTVSKVSATICLTANARAVLEVDWAAYRQRLGIEVDGDRAMAEIPMMGAELDAERFVPKVYRRQLGGSVKPQVLEDYVPTPTEACFDLQFETLDDAIRHGKPLLFPFNPETALRVQEVLDAMGRSIARGGAEELVRHS